jgi:Carboxypeptidase regulatory-like domain
MLIKRIVMKFLLLAMVVSFSTMLKAQDVASITGQVTDTSGAVIPGTNVVLVNTTTSTTYKAVTNSAGEYTIPNVTPGPGYKVTFSRDGFKSVAISGLYLNVDATRTQNAKLPVGVTAQTVEVSASSENVTLDTTDATIGNNFEVQTLNDLPIQNRDSPAALFYQQPGVTLDGAVTGARVDQSNVTLDGLEVNDEATGNFGAIVANAPVDSVQEFRGVTAGAMSSAGQGGGGQFELVTRSGTNNFHGALVEYHRDTDFEANDWFNNNADVPRPPLIRNQFGGNAGGPILRNRLFFFFDYNGRRDTLTNLRDRTVPLDSYRSGNVSYVNTANVIETLNPAQVAALDPLGIGYDPSLLSLMNQRYPHANDLTGDVGDLVNTAGFRFNAPFPYKEDDYVQKLDYNLNSKMTLFGRGTFTRTTGTEGAIQFPGDPLTAPFLDQSYAWVVGHTWTISTTKVNRASYGETFENYAFPVIYNPQGDNQYSFAGLSGPYAGGNNSQKRTYPIPTLRDDFSWEKGKHSLSFGGTFKWETPNEFADENYNFPAVGVTGNTYFTGLTPNLRPSDINSAATTIYDNAFSTALGAFAEVSSNFNYNNKGAVQPQASGLDLIYRYYETEVYAGDTWKLTPSLTVSYGVRYQNYTVPYETHGEQARSNITFDGYFGDRIKQSAAGISTDDALPFIQYTLGGKANNAPGYYHPANKNFAPRIGFAYSPSFDKKSVFSAGAGIIYDHSIVNALQFQQLQNSYLFEALGITNLFGTPGSPTATLQTAPRFGGITAAPPPPAAPSVATPYIPFVYQGYPYGLGFGEFTTIIDPNLKTPYSIQYNGGFQHEFPQGYILKVNYAGRLGRRLLAEADASQLVEFPDNTGKSNQKMSAAMAGMTTQLRNNAGSGALNDIYSLSAQPWFEDMLPGFAAYVAANNPQLPPPANNTQAVALEAYPYPQRGDFADTIANLAGSGYLPSNVGMASQFAADTIWTNKGFSSYNGMLVTLHKNVGYGLQFDINYTWSHSIDNVSFTANSIAGNVGFGFICDAMRPRECRGNSDFDVTNYLNGSFIYALPFGRGASFAATAPQWLNEVIGGWSVSGLPSWHTGPAYQAFSNAFVTGFANNAPATLIGPIGLLKTHVNGGEGAPLNAFSNPTGAVGAYTGPTGFDIGTRNNLRGPGYFDLDLGLGKTFPIYEDKVNLKFRADAFNATNHPNFATPSASDITQQSGVPFGTITSTVTPPSSDQAARVLQVSLRLEF